MCNEMEQYNCFINLVLLQYAWQQREREHLCEHFLVVYLTLMLHFDTASCITV